MENKQKQSTLVIHPKDRSTDFLKPIYENIPDVTVLTEGIYEDVVRGIKDNDRVIMMRHGSPSGLFNVSWFKNCVNRNYLISNEYHMVKSLLEKKDNIYIWCNADKFVNEYELKGFYSGMFISEVGEAVYCGIKNPTRDMVNESNEGFVKILSKYVNHPTDVIYENVVREYSTLGDINPIAKYNCDRLYSRELLIV